MSKSIKDYLPPDTLKPKTPKVRVQGMVDVSVAIGAQKIMERYNLGWNEVISACLKKFNNDMKEITR